MVRPIEVQSIRQTALDCRNPFLKTVHLLPGAIEGVETKYYLQEQVTSFSPARHPSRSQVFLFIRGTAEVQCGGNIFSFDEVAALCAPGTGPIAITATSQSVEYLEILIDSQEHEAAPLRTRAPAFVLYSQCEPYAEAIKSPKTISRTIVPANTIPRFCMGSVETVGPDTVGAHSHPMLEQFFLGLPGNACLVTADGVDAVFGEGMLLHIPLGSQHGVQVQEGKRLHYVWMDFFKNEADLTYIQKQHKPIAASPSPNA